MIEALLLCALVLFATAVASAVVVVPVPHRSKTWTVVLVACCTATGRTYAPAHPTVRLRARTMGRTKQGGNARGRRATEQARFNCHRVLARPELGLGTHVHLCSTLGSRK